MFLKPRVIKHWLSQETHRVGPSCFWWCVSDPSPTHSYRALGHFILFICFYYFPEKKIQEKPAWPFHPNLSRSLIKGIHGASSLLLSCSPLCEQVIDLKEGSFTLEHNLLCNPPGGKAWQSQDVESRTRTTGGLNSSKPHPHIQLIQAKFHFLKQLFSNCGS